MNPDQQQQIDHLIARFYAAFDNRQGKPIACPSCATYSCPLQG